MHPAIKLIVGVIIFLIGLWWYVPGTGLARWVPITVGSTFQAFLVVFFGLFGLFLIGLGLIIAWIEYEDLKWEKREKSVTEPKLPVTKAPAKKK